MLLHLPVIIALVVAQSGGQPAEIEEYDFIEPPSKLEQPLDSGAVISTLDTASPALIAEKADDARLTLAYADFQRGESRYRFGMGWLKTCAVMSVIGFIPGAQPIYVLAIPGFLIGVPILGSGAHEMNRQADRMVPGFQPHYRGWTAYGLGVTGIATGTVLTFIGFIKLLGSGYLFFPFVGGDSDDLKEGILWIQGGSFLALGGMVSVLVSAIQFHRLGEEGKAAIRKVGLGFSPILYRDPTGQWQSGGRVTLEF